MHNTAFLQTANRLRTKVNHALCLHDFAWEGSNTFPMNRLFFIFRSTGGFIRHMDGGRVINELELRTNHIYFMPKNADLTFRFEQGTGVVAFHYLLEMFGCFDLLDGISDCRAAEISEQEITQVKELMDHTDAPRDILMLQALLLKHSGTFMNQDEGRLPELLFLGERYQILFEQIEKRPDAQLTINDLAQAAGISRDMLSKNFRRDFGLPLKTFLQRRLVDQAAEMLLYTPLRIGEIAAALNFNDEYYFSRFFKKHKGTSPTQFRKTNDLEQSDLS